MKQYRNYTVVLLSAPVLLQAQKQHIHTDMVWLGYYNTMQFSNRYSLNSDIQFRTKEWVSQWSQQLIRTGLSYKINDQSSITAGFAWFRNAKYKDNTVSFLNEWRPWQEYAHSLNAGKFLILQRVRLEERFLELSSVGKTPSPYNYITRLRYRLEAQVPLKKNKIYFGLINEIMVNPAYIKTPKFLDQNRTFASLDVRVSNATTIQGQVMKIVVWHQDNVLEDQNVLRFNIVQSLNLKRK